METRSDIWSLGITLLEAIIGRIPFKEENGSLPTDPVTMQKLIKNFSVNNEVDKFLRNYSKDLQFFIKQCLRPVAERPDYETLMESDFYLKIQTLSFGFFKLY